MKKTEKKFGGKEKRCTFAIPFGKRGSERPRRGQEERCGRTSRRGHRKFIEKTGQRQYKRSTEKQRASIRGRDTGIEDGATGHSLRYNKDYTMKSLILAQDER